ncbi:hypothetical protein [Clostridium merdae]|uniref:hypothetical protein n=1 Tax=Clostridium merdae TaxID=1958780 RepID=UPI000A2681D9|nr:hypothetical protein [Clostridium merdae]
MIIMGAPKEITPETSEDYVINSDGIEVFASQWQRKHWGDVPHTLSTEQGLAVETIAAGSQSAKIYCASGTLTGSVNRTAMVKIGKNYHLIAVGGTATANKVPVTIYPQAPSGGYEFGTPLTFCDSSLEVHDFVLGDSTWVYQPGFRAYQLIDPPSCGYLNRPKGFFVTKRPVGTEGRDYNVVTFHPFYAAKYQMSDANSTSSAHGSSGIAVSKSWTVPWGYISFDDAVIACSKTNSVIGKDIPTRMIRDDEWVSLAIYAQLLGPNVFGSNCWGPFGKNRSGYVTDIDDISITFTSDPTSSSRALTGSGAKSGWKIGQNLTTHTGRVNGVYDLNGNVSEWTSGLKLKSGSDGYGVLFVDEMDTGVQLPSAGTGSNVTELHTDLKVAKHAIAGAWNTPGRAEFGFDYQYNGNQANAEYVPYRGGTWNSGTNAGVFCVLFDRTRTYSNYGVGFRAAFEA